MIQITLRSIDGSSPSEERIQRPERPQRANRPLGNTSPLQSFIIRTHTGQNAGGREELPRPNAPVRDENYNNRSISPLFANQSTSVAPYPNYHPNRVVHVSQMGSNSQPCEHQSSGSQIVDVDYSESQQVVTTNNEDDNSHAPSEFSDPTTEHQQANAENQPDNFAQQNWNERNMSHNINTTDRSDENFTQINENNQSGIMPRTERPLLLPRTNRGGNFRDERQEARNQLRTSINQLWERERHWTRRSRLLPSARNMPVPTPTSSTNSSTSPQTSMQNSGFWNGLDVIPRRSLRREEPDFMSVPPLINLVEGDDDAETTGSGNRPEQVFRWINQSTNQSFQNSERRDTWEDDTISLEGLDDAQRSQLRAVTLLVQEEEEDEEEDSEDNEVLMSLPPEDRKPRAHSSQSEGVSTCQLDNESSRNNDIRKLILSALECPVCFEYVASPVVQCHEGHLVCNKCRIRLNHCPECRGPFSTVRPRAVEKIANYLEYPCSYEGCTQLITPANRVLHAKSCSFRSFICPVMPRLCPWTGQKMAMRDHILNIHDRNLHWISGPKLTFLIRPLVGKERVFIMEALDHLFHVKFTVATGEKLRGCVTLLGFDPSRDETMNVIVLVQSFYRTGPCLMMMGTPSEESDEMDMRLGKFATFNISQLLSRSPPPPLRVRVAIGKKDILKALDRIFD